MKPARLFRAFALVALGVVGAAVPARAAPIAGTFTQLVVFGDSLSDTGNVLNATQNSLLTAARPTTPWYQPGKFTDGPAVTGPNQTSIPSTLSAYGLDWDERLAQLLGINGFKASSSGGTNYATGGAETGSGNFSRALGLPNMGQQVTNYIASNPTPTTNTLFALWGGGNDLMDAAQAKGATADTIATAETNAIGNITSEISTLSEKYPGKAINFLWPNLPPLAATPMAQTFTEPIQTGLADSSQQFATDEIFAILGLEDQFPNDHIYDLDIYGLFQNVLANPKTYGFTNTTESVIKASSFSGAFFSATPNFPNTTVNPDTFLFWDQLHPTSAVHDLMGVTAYNLLPEPGTGLLISIGFMVAAARRARGSGGSAV